MATAQNSNVLVENVNKLLTTFLPANTRRDGNNLYSIIGVKSHGTIAFPDNKSNRAEFIRVAPDAPVASIRDLLNQQWCRGRPSLVISVTGGAKEYNMKPKLLRAFRRGLLKVARTTGAWIITGGMNTGIMKLVGEIVQINPDRSRPIHLIGIATWGCVSGFQQLDVHGSTVHYSQPRSEAKGEAPLEPNHTEFIFIDDGRVRKYGGEIAFRAKLEQTISSGFFGSKNSVTGNNQYQNPQSTMSFRQELSDPVPVVLLVVEGGPNTVRTVHEAVVQNNIPAVFLEGTGRCCDLFAKAIHFYNDALEKLELNDETLSPLEQVNRHNELKKRLRQELNEDLHAFGGDTGTPNTQKQSSKPASNANARAVDTTDYFELIYECVHTRINFLNVISLNSRNPVEPDIDLAILQALLNATSGIDACKTNIQRKREQLRLALHWNRVDIAKNYIMRDDRDWEKIDLNDLFLTALERNQVAFVKLFLDRDFSLTDLFRNNRILLEMYLREMKYDHLHHIHDNDYMKAIYKEIIQPLIGDFFEVDAALPQTDCGESHNVIDFEDSATCFCCKRKNYQAASCKDSQSVRIDGTNHSPDYILDMDKELFLWSVVTGRRDFALLFWSRGKNKICAALFATAIYTKCARKDNDNTFLHWAEEFEQLAVEILDKFYQANPKRCTKAIIRQIPAYGNVTWLDLAIAAEAKQFIAQRAVQDVLNNIWYGYIEQDVPVSKLVFSTIMIWYSGFLPYENELVETREEISFLDDSLNRAQTLKTQPSQDLHVIQRPNDEINMRLFNRMTDDENPEPLDFVAVGCWENTVVQVRQYFTNILTFIRAPYVKYLYNLYFHVIFLLLFSYVIICDFFPLYDYPVDVCSPSRTELEYLADYHNDKEPISQTSNVNKTIAYGFKKHDRPATTEFILVIWVFSLLCEEIRQLFTIEAQTYRSALAAYFGNYWNQLDCLAVLLFFVGFVLRFLPTSECFCAARLVLSIDLTIWFIRSMDIFAAIKRLGPKLVMIGEMVHDLKFFMLMLTVFILAFGASTYSLVYGVQEFTWHLPRRIVNLAYWQIFGELSALEIFEHDYKPNGYVTFILLVAYMTVASILLVNLLIAMFSNTFDRLQTNTDRIWKFQRYQLVREYLSRPSLPPPFILFSHLYRFILFVLSQIIKSKCIREAYEQHISRTKYKISLDEKRATHIEIAEDAFGDEVYYNYLKINRKLVAEADLDEERVQTPQETMLNRIRTVENRLQTLYNQQAHMFDYLECLMDGLKTIGGDRIRVPERRRLDPDESLVNQAQKHTFGKRTLSTDV